MRHKGLLLVTLTVFAVDNRLSRGFFTKALGGIKLSAKWAIVYPVQSSSNCASALKNQHSNLCSELRGHVFPETCSYETVT